MRTITIPPEVMLKAVNGPIRGTCVEFAVAVDWPELTLTEAQIMENAIAWANGFPHPHPDQQIFSIQVPYIEKTI